LLIERQSLIHQTTTQKRTGDTLPLEVTAPIVVLVRANSRIPLVGRGTRARAVCAQLPGALMEKNGM
jgi:hypothetical protein